MNTLTDLLDYYSNYENCVLMGAFNAEPREKLMSTFICDQNLFNHIKQKHMLENEQLSNKKLSLQHSNVFETGLSDHHLLVFTMLKTTFQKLPPKHIKYRCYQKFVQHNTF